MSGARRGRLGTVAVAAATVLAVGGCGRAAPEQVEAPPVVVAEPVPMASGGLSPGADPSPTPEPSPEPSPEPPVGGDADGAEEAADGSAPAVGPTGADAAAFLASEAVADLDGVEHVVVDLDGDTWDEVVATGVRDRTGHVRIAWWTVDGYEVLAADEAGAGRDVTDLRAADVNRDDRIELLVTVEGEGLQSLAVWRVTGRGKVQRLEAVGGCHDGSHVFGVTTANLQQGGDGPPAIVADCDESPLPVADWSEHRWSWQDGAYQHVAPPSSDAPGGDDGAGEDDDEDGDDQGQDGDDDQGSGQGQGGGQGNQGQGDQGQGNQGAGG